MDNHKFLSDRILWKRIDIPGHDACRLEQTQTGWRLFGSAAFVDGSVLTNLSYRVEHDRKWNTQSVLVSGLSGDQALDIIITRGERNVWRYNDKAIGQIATSQDIDLGFTPATNTSAIRRLNLAVGEEENITAAWLDVKDWTLKPLKQKYARVSESVYQYASVSSGYQVELSVNENGLVMDYPDCWKVEE